MPGPLKFWTFVILAIVAVGWGVRRWERGSVAPEAVAAPVAAGAEVPATAPRDVVRSLPVEASLEPAPELEADAESVTPVAPAAAAEVERVVGPLVPAAAVAEEIAARAPAVVILFSTKCSNSKRLFPKFAKLARSLSEDTTVLAYSTLESDVRRLPEFLAANGATFEASVLERWEPGELSGALSGVGLRLGETWTQPFVAVVGEGGAVLGQWDGVQDLRPVERALAAGGMLR